MTVIGGDEITCRSRKGAGDIKVSVVSSLDEMQQVFAVRASVYLGKPGWTYSNTFDKNDHCATHILGCVNDEPVGTARIRWFGGFARIERIAIREEYRSLALLNQIADTALRICRRKGFPTIGGLTYPSLVPFWSRKGALPCGDPIESEYGVVVPILGTMEDGRYPDITPLGVADAGRPDFEWAAYGWEGDVTKMEKHHVE